MLGGSYLTPERAFGYDSRIRFKLMARSGGYLQSTLVRRFWTACLLVAGPVLAQNVPVVSSGGIVNAASYNLASTSVAPGSIATIFGSNLSNGTVCVSPCGPVFDKNGVLVPTLAGTTVTFNGFTAPVISVPSSNQIGVQVPVEMAGTSSASVVVTVNGQSSAPVTVPIASVAPGIFSINAAGSGLGAILNAQDANLGLVSIAGPWFDFPNSHTAQPGDVIEIYATGLGGLTTPVPTGTAPKGNPQTAVLPTVTIGGAPATVQFSGEAPCCVGLNQINVVIPAFPGSNAIPNGAAVPLVLTIGGQASNMVTIAMGGTVAGIGGTAQSLTGSINNGNISRLGMDLPIGASMTGSYAVSGDGSDLSGHTVYSLTGNGSGTVSSCALTGSASPGNWVAAGTMTITMNSAIGRAQIALGSYTASTSFTVCGTALPARIANGGVIAFISPTGTVSLILVRPIGGPMPSSPFTGSVDSGITGLLTGAGSIWGDPKSTGGITLTSSSQSSDPNGQTVYALSGSGSGTTICSVFSPAPSGQTGPWSLSLSSTFTLSPAPASLVNRGGSITGTYDEFAGTGTGCGAQLAPIKWQGGTLVGTVFPGGGITLWLIPSGTGTGP